MATTLTDFMTKLGIRLNQTIDTASEPSTTKVYQVLGETYDWITGLCADNEVDISRKVASITLADGTALYRDCCEDLFVPAQMGWLLKTYQRDELNLCNWNEIINYSPDSGAETEPTKYSIGPNGEVTFYQTPDDTYTAKIPYYYHQTIPSALTYTISGATQADPCVITATSHGFKTGDRTKIASVAGMTELNNNWYTVTYVSANTFSLDGVDSSAYTAYTSGGSAHVAIAFNGAFDNVVLESISMRFQNINDPNRPTYQMQFEDSWLKFLLGEATKIIQQRKGLTKKVMR